MVYGSNRYDPLALCLCHSYYSFFFFRTFEECVCIRFKIIILAFSYYSHILESNITYGCRNITASEDDIYTNIFFFLFFFILFGVSILLSFSIIDPNQVHNISNNYYSDNNFGIFLTPSHIGWIHLKVCLLFRFFFSLSRNEA